MPGKKQQELDSLLYFARASRQISKKEFQEEHKKPVSKYPLLYIQKGSFNGSLLK